MEYDQILNTRNIFAVVGVSSNLKKYGYKVFNNLKTTGYSVYAINPNVDHIGDVKVYNSLKDLPEKIDVVVCIVPPKITLDIVKQAKELDIKNIWMQPGSESEEAINFCKEEKINLIYNQCIIINNKNEK